jgi:hypothetical protein
MVRLNTGGIFALKGINLVYYSPDIGGTPRISPTTDRALDWQEAAPRFGPHITPSEFGDLEAILKYCQ